MGTRGPDWTSVSCAALCVTQEELGLPRGSAVPPHQLHAEQLQAQGTEQGGWLGALQDSEVCAVGPGNPECLQKNLGTLPEAPRGPHPRSTPTLASYISLITATCWVPRPEDSLRSPFSGSSWAGSSWAPFPAGLLCHPLLVFHRCWDRLSGDRVGGTSWHPLRTQGPPPQSRPSRGPTSPGPFILLWPHCSSQETAVYLGEVLGRARSQLEPCFPFHVQGLPRKQGWRGREVGRSAGLPGVCEN